MRSTTAAALVATTSLLLSLASAGGTLQLDIAGKVEFYQSEQLQRRASTKSPGTVTAPLTENSRFVQYYANITVGTPAQAVALVIDTGSSDVWVISPGASSCRKAGCPLGTFDYTKSSTFVDNGQGQFQDSYADGSSSTGDFFQDTFGIGGATVQSFEMGLALNTSLAIGIMGVAFEAGEAGGSVNYPNLVDTMVNQSVIATQAYSLWLNDLDARSGSLLFGGIDTAKYSGTLANIAMYPSADTGAIDRFTVAFTSFSITSGSGTDTLTPANYKKAVVLDSGTTLTYLPDDLAHAILNEVGAIYDSEAGLSLCSCGIANAQGTLSFGFAGPNGPVIKVPISEMVYPLMASNGTQINFDTGLPACLFGIVPASSVGGDAPLLFGDTLLRSAYVVYDLVNQRIGLAQTNFNSTGSNVVAFPSLGAQIPSATTVSNELAVTQTASKGNVGATVGATVGGGSGVSATGVQFTGNAGPGFSSAAATATKKSAAGPGPGPVGLEKLILVALTMGLMGLGGVMILL